MAGNEKGGRAESSGRGKPYGKQEEREKVDKRGDLPIIPRVNTPNEVAPSGSECGGAVSVLKLPATQDC